MTIRTPYTSWLTVLVAVLLVIPVAAQKVTKRSLTIAGKSRTVHVFVPEGLPAPAPLLLLLHGSGREGTSLTNVWQGLAKKEGIVLIAPDSLAREGWNLAPEGPQFFYDVIQAIKSETAIDPRRMYLFGHSAGGHHGIDMALLESEYFAAAAIHAGGLTHDHQLIAGHADRKIPISIWSGTADRLVPIVAVRQTRDFLNSQGFAVKLVELAGHTHDYYSVAADINKSAWAFLKEQQLTQDPYFKQYK